MADMERLKKSEK